MDPWAREELESEYFARMDYLAELAAEHFDPDWDWVPEEEAGEDAVAAGDVWDDIPF